MRTLEIALTLLLLAPTISLAQPRGGVLRVRLTNGTTGEPGRAESVTLFRLRNEMVPVAELGDVSGSFEIDDIEVEGERPMLLQVTYQGVNYNEPIRFGRGYEAEADVTVYDVISDWNDEALEVTTSRFLYRRDGDKLLVDSVFVVENRTDPPKTYYDPDGTFRFNLPTSKLLQMRSVSASGTGGMPVPQQASPHPGGTGYVTKTAFKPGETEIAISYDVSYENERYAFEGQAFYPLSELLVFVSPPDIAIQADDWQNLGPEPQGRFVALRKENVAPGAPLRYELSGGSSEAPALGPSSSADSSSAPSGGGSGSGTVTLIPDTSRPAKWVIVILMAAALGYGILVSLYPSARRG